MTMPDRTETGADAQKQRHLYPRDSQGEKADFNPHADESDVYSGRQGYSGRRGVGDDVADAGRVEPYGHLEVRDDYHLDSHIWVCGSCGYQTGSLEDPDSSCPNCTTQGEFVIQHM